MTLDRSFFTLPTKGHFCSLLVSIILCDPLFLSLPFALSLDLLNTLPFFSNKNTVCYRFSIKAKGEAFGFSHSPVCAHKFISYTHKETRIYQSIGFFFLPNYQSDRSVRSFGKALEFKLPLDCTSLSSLIV